MANQNVPYMFCFIIIIIIIIIIVIIITITVIIINYADVFREWLKNFRRVWRIFWSFVIFGNVFWKVSWFSNISANCWKIF